MTIISKTIKVRQCDRCGTEVEDDGKNDKLPQNWVRLAYFQDVDGVRIAYYQDVDGYIDLCESCKSGFDSWFHMVTKNSGKGLRPIDQYPVTTRNLDNIV
jgi:hypothetical protein